MLELVLRSRNDLMAEDRFCSKPEAEAVNTISKAPIMVVPLTVITPGDMEPLMVRPRFDGA